MLDRVRRYIEHHHLLPTGARVIVGLSGGVDSVVLAHLLDRLDYEVVAAHVNYGLRGAASDEDEAFVDRYCKEKDIALDVLRVGKEFKKKAAGRSLQEAARDLRYRFFADLARREEAGFVAVAHHLDDQVETVLLHLLRGSGVEGVSGMTPSRPLERGAEVRLVRPLLEITREEIEAYAQSADLTWREDETNAGVDYERNRIRHALIPIMREQFGEASVQNVARAADYLQGYYTHTIAPDLERRFEACISPEIDEPHLLIEPLSRQPDVWKTRLVLEALQRWAPGMRYGANHADAVCQLIEAQVGRKVLLEEGTVWRERDRLVFSSNTPDQSHPEGPVSLYPGDRYSTSDGMLRVVTEVYRPGMPLDAGPDEALMDAARIHFPLSVRPWHAGDRITPLGMAGQKKVSDLLTDARIPSHQRSSVQVVLSGQEIVWVVGVRLADSVKVGEDTVRIARLTFERDPDTVKKG